MTIKTNIKAGRRSGIGNGSVLTFNHNQTQAAQRTRSLKIKTSIKAGHDPLPRHPPPKWTFNHNETQVRTRGFRVRSGIKAGPVVLIAPKKGQCNGC